LEAFSSPAKLFQKAPKFLTEKHPVTLVQDTRNRSLIFSICYRSL